MSLQATTSQTVGPFFLIGLERLFVDNLAGPGVSGERVEIKGRVLDADGQGVPDAMLELCKANTRIPKTRRRKTWSRASVATAAFPPQRTALFVSRPSSLAACQVRSGSCKRRTLWSPYSCADCCDGS